MFMLYSPHIHVLDFGKIWLIFPNHVRPRAVNDLSLTTDRLLPGEIDTWSAVATELSPGGKLIITWSPTFYKRV